MKMTFFMESENEKDIYIEVWLNEKPLGHSLILETVRFWRERRGALLQLSLP